MDTKSGREQIPPFSFCAQICYTLYLAAVPYLPARLSADSGETDEMKLHPNKNISEGYHRLETMMMSLVADSLCREGSYVWGNIFAPL